MTEAIDIDTPHGPARAHLHHADDPRAALVLGHGAGGGVEAPDLKAATAEALERGVSVALVEQPYRVAGKKSSPRPNQLDPAWLAVTAHLAAHDLEGLPQITGGRSAGARVACRTAAESGAVGVLCLAFPLQPPGAQGRHARRQPPGRAGRRRRADAGGPGGQGPLRHAGERGRARRWCEIKGDHSLRSDAEALRNAVGEWLSNF